MVRHGRYAIFKMAEAAIPRRVFAAILTMIYALRGPPRSGALAWLSARPDRQQSMLAIAKMCSKTGQIKS